MTAGDLYTITKQAENDPTILSKLVFIYNLGYKQSIIDQIKKEIREMERKLQ